jgi:hypothetical protein
MSGYPYEIVIRSKKYTLVRLLTIDRTVMFGVYERKLGSLGSIEYTFSLSQALNHQLPNQMRV